MTKWKVISSVVQRRRLHHGGARALQSCNRQAVDATTTRERLYDVNCLTQSVPIKDLSQKKWRPRSKPNAALGASFVHEAEISDFLTPVPVHKPSSERLLYTIQETSV